MAKPDSAQPPSGGRRDFLKASALLGGGILAGTAMLAGPGPLAFGVHVGGSDVLRIGLVGCGGRGTGAAADALQADPNLRLVAMADLFEDRLKGSLASLQKDKEIGKKVAVTPERQFVGFEAYKQLIASGVDVVLLATPPHFRPAHLKAAVDAGLHVFAEKPVAVDAPGVRSVLATCAEAKKKNLSIVSGLCLRCSYAFRELVRRIHDGALGEIHTLQANDYRGAIWTKTRQPGESDMHWQTRNWYYYTWLSGDFNVEQHVHFLDVCAWIMKGRYPVRAIGMGGRQVRTGPQFGNIFDHHSVIYEYDDGVKFFSNTRQMAGCAGDMSAAVAGSKGRAIIAERKNGAQIIAGGENWTFRGPDNNIYHTEHDEMFAAIRKGQPINNGEYMAKSTLLAILGRMATYTGQVITWEQAMNSKEDLSPPKYEWGPLPEPAVAVPGVTPFV
ncbi:MAG: Gfo/Idh/MocA family oxidoreductase [Thermoguttaceae bacterium]|jgi:predicted dehydrogenase